MSAVSIEQYDPMDRACQQDPFPYYAALREQAPVYRHPRNGIYFVSRFEDVSAVLRDPATFSSRFGTTGLIPAAPGAEKEMEEIFAQGVPAVNTLLTADPPAQTRYRKAVARAFTPKRIQAHTGMIRELTDGLIDRWPLKGRVDYLGTFSIPLPVRVISTILSIGLERGDDVKRWSDDSVAGLGVTISRERSLEAARSLVGMQKFLAGLLEARRAQPRGDFLSELAAADFEPAEGAPRKLDVPEMLSIVTQLMVAGNEAMTKGINEITRLLIEHPEEWRRIVDDPSTIPAMVDEGLRLASPNQGLFRIATRDTEIQGVPIPKRARVWVMFGSANRDERVFPDPDRFDPRRPNLSEHLAFGRGAHFCIGAPLARLELNILFEQLAARIETLDFAPENRFEYEPSFILRGLKSLEVEIERRS